MRVGLGYDMHRLVADRDLILGGVTIPFHLGLLGHSDADVLCHAISDALLGAAALGDIGQHFPDTDPAFKGISSIKLLQQVSEILAKEHFRIVNIDAVIMMQRPKVAPFLPQMREKIAAALTLAVSAISVKATTTEGLDSIGREEGVAAQAIALIE